jgi:[ribosomal protein S5]-alanine N-acetyltransferase
MNPVDPGRLTLEPQTAAHAEEMFRVLSDPAIYEYENEAPESLQWLRDRFARLESRQSADGRELWLNWVVRLAGGELIGYVQATVLKDRRAMIAYVFASQYWGHGYALEAVRAMMSELGEHYAVRRFLAVFKRSNARSRRLLERLGFALPEAGAGCETELDEMVMERVGLLSPAQSGEAPD